MVPVTSKSIEGARRSSSKRRVYVTNDAMADIDVHRHQDAHGESRHRAIASQPWGLTSAMGAVPGVAPSAALVSTKKVFENALVQAQEVLEIPHSWRRYEVYFEYPGWGNTYCNSFTS